MVLKENLPSGLNTRCYICLATLSGLRDVRSTSLHGFRDGCSRATNLARWSMTKKNWKLSDKAIRRGLSAWMQSEARVT